jgi:hypothetical protein
MGGLMGIDRRRSQVALETWLERIEPGPRVLVIGPTHRTWTDDVNAIVHVFDHLPRDTVILTGERRPFVTWMKALSEMFVLDMITDADYAYGQKTKVLGCSPDLYEIAQNRIVLPAEDPPPVSGLRIMTPVKKSQRVYDLTSADPGLVHAPPRPTLVLRRYFDWEVIL